MIMQMTRTQITFPVEIERACAREEAIWVVRISSVPCLHCLPLSTTPALQAL